MQSQANPLFFAKYQQDGIMSLKRTLLNAYKDHTHFCPSKTKKITFQTLNRTMRTCNKTYKSGLSLDTKCLRCEEPETMEHLLLACENYSVKIRA
jgi:hypothetical protein